MTLAQWANLKVLRREAATPSLMPLAGEEPSVAVLMPHRRRRLPLLAERVHGDDPVARLRTLVGEFGRLDRLFRDAGDVPGPFEPVHMVAGDSLFRVGGPLQLGQRSLLAIEDAG